ncbi:MAG: hypothetical protein IPI35_05325 [Deltaproteobacteria bacterium]|nr:hypothetical protein [Deltaproteobacteria bacterium]
MRPTATFALFVTLFTLACKPAEPPVDTAVEPPDEEVIDADGDGSPSTEDCDDDDAAVNPDATETCDGLDNNCDGQTDEGVLTTYTTDADGDGYGDDSTATEACAPPEGAVEVGGDCDDDDARYNPGAAETDCADPNDYNCDGSTGYADGDNDGYAACAECDDADAAVNPGATEVCDDRDNNCDGLTDENVTETWWQDTDGDNFGDADYAYIGCAQPEGYTDNVLDCDDGDGAVNPDADEVCDGLDNDCDGTIDGADAIDVSTYYTDADNDGFGDASAPLTACELPSGAVADNNDCDDGDSAVNPDADEVCDGLDNDCDGVTDGADAIDLSTYYADDDNDGYGDASAPLTACEAPSGAVSDNNDCDDGDGDSYPGAAEACDNTDNDCDTETDEEVCECTFETYGGHEYLFCAENLNWADAYAECLSYGYDLVAITDAAEDAWVWATAYALVDTDWWIGLNDHSSEGSFVWTTGEATSYTGWSPGEPNNSYLDGSAENCVHIGWYAPTSAWNDFGCAALNHFVCEG